jgi:cell wall-associated NlpC family hydrolase
MKTTSLLTAIVLSLVLAATCFAREQTPKYAVALFPTPVLNTPDFAAVFGGRDGRTVQSDRCGLIRAMEFVALPGTPFRIEATVTKGNTVIYRVSTDDYPYPTTSGYFIDGRFVRTTDTLPPPRPRKLPPREEVIARLLDARGSRYVWGGNVRAGVPELLSFYPPAAGAPLPPETLERWELKGVDCSGLLYEATGGYTPRNTSTLVGYGKGVPIAGLATAQIVRLVAPLDLIVWEGHVMIVLDRERLIESRLGGGGGQDGVRVRPLREALDELRAGRVPVNDYGAAAARGVKGFVIRRWWH